MRYLGRGSGLGGVCRSFGSITPTVPFQISDSLHLIGIDSNTYVTETSTGKSAPCIYVCI